MSGMNPFLASSMLQKQLQSSTQSQRGLNDMQQGGGGSAGGGAGRSVMAAAMAGLPLSSDHLQFIQNAGIAFQHQQKHQQQHLANLPHEAQASAVANDHNYHLLQQLQQQLQQLQEMKHQQQRQLSGESSGSLANGTGNGRSKDETNSAASAMIELSSGSNETSPAQRSIPSKSAFGSNKKESIKNRKKATVATSRATAWATATLTCKPVAQGEQGQPQNDQGKQQQLLQQQQQQQQQQQLPRNKFPTVPCRARGMPVDHSFKTAYFRIQDDIKHGEGLVCSYPECRNRGIKFLYCAYCRGPVAKRAFRTGHGHNETEPHHQNQDAPAAAKPKTVALVSSGSSLLKKDKRRTQDSSRKRKHHHKKRHDSSKRRVRQKVSSGNNDDNEAVTVAVTVSTATDSSAAGTSSAQETPSENTMESSSSTGDLSTGSASSDHDKKKPGLDHQRKQAWRMLLASRPDNDDDDHMSRWLMRVMAVSDKKRSLPADIVAAIAPPAKVAKSDAATDGSSSGNDSGSENVTGLPLKNHAVESSASSTESTKSVQSTTSEASIPKKSQAQVDVSYLSICPTSQAATTAISTTKGGSDGPKGRTDMDMKKISV